MKDTGSQGAAEAAWGKGAKGKNMKYPCDARSDEMSGSRNVVQETAAYLVDATEAAEGLDAPHNR